MKFVTQMPSQTRAPCFA